MSACVYACVNVHVFVSMCVCVYLNLQVCVYLLLCVSTCLGLFIILSNTNTKGIVILKSVINKSP